MNINSSAVLSPKTLRILLVDDDAEVLTSLAIVLRRDGHVVACAPSGRAALEQLAAGPPLDVVLTDLGMPDVNGWVVARTAKESRPTIVVGLITGWGHDHLGTERERATVDFILAKPVDRRTLAAALAHATQRPAAA
jgi:CheY-like chemotaxis protein